MADIGWLWPRVIASVFEWIAGKWLQDKELICRKSQKQIYQEVRPFTDQ
jgi:hypothetical protein